MSSQEERIKVVRYWWSKAEESLASARREFDAGAYPFAVNRLYYAAFYGVSAALLERELSFKKHSGVRATFHREFIKTGLLDIEWGKFMINFWRIAKRAITPLSYHLTTSTSSPNWLVASSFWINFGL